MQEQSFLPVWGSFGAHCNLALLRVLGCCRSHTRASLDVYQLFLDKATEAFVHGLPFMPASSSLSSLALAMMHVRLYFRSLCFPIPVRKGFGAHLCCVLSFTAVLQAVAMRVKEG